LKILSKTAALVLMLMLSSIGVALWATHALVDRQSRAELQEQAFAELALHSEILRGWLGRFRSLAPIYAHEQSVVELLKNPNSPELVDAMNARLERWNAVSGAADTYVLNHNGTAIASSNWNADVSFVGRNYDYRPYFTHAMQGRLGRFFAVGTASKRRGYYFAYPVQDDGPIVGVVVVKIPVGLIEEEMRLGRNGVFVTDENGVVILAGPPEWRLRTTDPLSDGAIEKIENERQFDVASLRPLAIEGQVIGKESQGALTYALPDRSSSEKNEFLHVSNLMTVENWTVHLLAETKTMQSQVITTTAIVGLGLTTLLLAALAFWQRRRRMIERMAEPLAAIRTYSDNAKAFLGRGRNEEAAENLSRISRLTDRMAQLSKHLTSFARKPKDTVEPIDLSRAIDEAIELLRGRLDKAAINLSIDVEPNIRVMGGLTRLQHVIMNLIANALDATSNQPSAIIRVHTIMSEASVMLIVDDNGIGLGKEAKEQMFDPFFSKKETGKGLGLGLSISYNIVRTRRMCVYPHSKLSNSRIWR